MATDSNEFKAYFENYSQLIQALKQISNEQIPAADFRNKIKNTIHKLLTNTKFLQQWDRQLKISGEHNKHREYKDGDHRHPITVLTNLMGPNQNTVITNKDYWSLTTLFTTPKTWAYPNILKKEKAHSLFNMLTAFTQHPNSVVPAKHLMHTIKHKEILTAVIRTGDYECFKLTHDWVMNENGYATATEMFTAIALKNERMIARLLRHDRVIQHQVYSLPQRVLSAAIKSRHLGILNHVCNWFDSGSHNKMHARLLCEAIDTGEGEILSRLLECKQAEIDKSWIKRQLGRVSKLAPSPLEYALNKRCLTSMRLLLDAGAKIDPSMKKVLDNLNIEELSAQSPKLSAFLIERGLCEGNQQSHAQRPAYYNSQALMANKKLAKTRKQEAPPPSYADVIAMDQAKQSQDPHFQATHKSARKQYEGVLKQQEEDGVELGQLSSTDYRCTQTVVTVDDSQQQSKAPEILLKEINALPPPSQKIPRSDEQAIIAQTKKQGSPVSGNIADNGAVKKKKPSQERQCMLELAR